MKKRKMALGLTLLSFFLIDMILVVSQATTNFDWWFYHLLPHSDVLTSIMKIITLIGEDITIIALSVTALLFIKKKNKAVFVPASAIMISLINTTLKFIIHRPRPEGIALISEGGYSFPSGHSVVAIVFYGFIAYMISKTELSNLKKNLITIVLISIIGLIGISRVYLGVHYVSDVLGGFLLGGSFLVAFTSLYDRSIKK